MANQSVAAGEVAARGTLVANTVDVITFASDLDSVEVASDGLAEVYFSVDGTTPASSSKTSYRIPATGGWNSVAVSVPTSTNTVVKLISTGAPKYEVSA